MNKTYEELIKKTKLKNDGMDFKCGKCKEETRITELNQTGLCDDCTQESNEKVMPKIWIKEVYDENALFLETGTYPKKKDHEKEISKLRRMNGEDEAFSNLKVCVANNLLISSGGWANQITYHLIKGGNLTVGDVILTEDSNNVDDDDEGYSEHTCLKVSPNYKVKKGRNDKVNYDIRRMFNGQAELTNELADEYEAFKTELQAHRERIEARELTNTATGEPKVHVPSEDEKKWTSKGEWNNQWSNTSIKARTITSDGVKIVAEKNINQYLAYEDIENLRRDNAQTVLRKLLSNTKEGTVNISKGQLTMSIVIGKVNTFDGVPVNKGKLTTLFAQTISKGKSLTKELIEAINNLGVLKNRLIEVATVEVENTQVPVNIIPTDKNGTKFKVVMGNQEKELSWEELSQQFNLKSNFSNIHTRWNASDYLEFMKKTMKLTPEQAREIFKEAKMLSRI